jgi:hypothetical protein
MRDWPRDLTCRRSFQRRGGLGFHFPRDLSTVHSHRLFGDPNSSAACLSAGHSPEEVTPAVLWAVSAQCKLVGRFRKTTDGTTFHCSDRDYSGAVTRESIRRPNTALHKYVIDRAGSLGCPTEPPRPYYHSRTENGKSQLRGCLSGLCSSGSGNNTILMAASKQRSPTWR